MSEKELRRLQEFSKLNSLRECPVCNGEVEKGYIHTGNDIWCDNKRLKWYDLTFSHAEIGIMARWRRSPNPPSHRCTDCKIIVFDYGEDEKR